MAFSAAEGVGKIIRLFQWLYFESPSKLRVPGSDGQVVGSEPPARVGAGGPGGGNDGNTWCKMPG